MVFGLGKNLLLKSVLGHCAAVLEVASSQLLSIQPKSTIKTILMLLHTKGVSCLAYFDKTHTHFKATMSRLQNEVNQSAQKQKIIGFI